LSPKTITHILIAIDRHVGRVHRLLVSREHEGEYYILSRETS